MKILLIYEEVPEQTKLYVIHADDHSATKISMCHGHYVNTTDIEKAPKQVKDACLWLSEWLQGQEPVAIKEGQPLTGAFDRIVITGFLL